MNSIKKRSSNEGLNEKMDYEPPTAMHLSKIRYGAGGYVECFTGSDANDRCRTGSDAGTGCFIGNLASGACYGGPSAY